MPSTCFDIFAAIIRDVFEGKNKNETLANYDMDVQLWGLKICSVYFVKYVPDDGQK
jgi:hypothetical protein